MEKQLYELKYTTYENFVKAHREAASNCIPLKPKKYKRVPLGNADYSRLKREDQIVNSS